jgi:hypothetical protein
MIIMITNTIVPYCYDIAHILGLPSNLSHRFRYINKWIHPSVEMQKLTGQDGLIVLRATSTGELLPIRCTKIGNVLTVGDINYIEFRLAHFLTAKEEATVALQIGREISRLGFQNEGGKELECLVFELELANTEQNGKQSDHQKWSRILKKIGKFECYKDFGFLKIERVRDAGGTVAPTARDETGKYAFLLKPSRLYFLDVIQHVPWEIDETESINTPYDVELKAEKDEVVLLRKIQRVVGKYDLLQFVFKTPAGYAPKHTFLEVENKQGGEIGKFGLPALFLPVLIEPPSWMKILRRTSYVVSAFAIVATVSAESLGSYFVLGADGVRGIALLLLVLATKKWDEFASEFIKGAKGIKIGNHSEE